MIKNIILILIVTLFLSGCSNEKKEETNSTTNTEVEYNRTASDVTITNTPFPNEVENTNTSPSTTQTPPVEEEIASFTTKIYTKDSERQNNISITCNTLNGTIVEPNATFSFTQTVGKATSDKGYQEADIFDANGNKKKGLGGGNCQVSTTLYNAVLQVPTLKVVERHEHSNKVPYIKDGMDAAVAYGSVDFKFTNANNYRIKIYAEPTKDNVTIRLVKV